MLRCDSRDCCLRAALEPLVALKTPRYQARQSRRASCRRGVADVPIRHVKQ